MDGMQIQQMLVAGDDKTRIAFQGALEDAILELIGAEGKSAAWGNPFGVLPEWIGDCVELVLREVEFVQKNALKFQLQGLRYEQLRTPGDGKVKSSSRVAAI